MAFGYALRFIPINRVRTTCSYRAKPQLRVQVLPSIIKVAVPAPSITHIWAITAFANRVKPVSIHKVADMF
jgi:hypothetical protein